MITTAADLAREINDRCLTTITADEARDLMHVRDLTRYEEIDADTLGHLCDDAAANA